MNEDDIRLVRKIAREETHEILDTEVWDIILEWANEEEIGIRAFKQRLGRDKGVYAHASVLEETFAILKFDSQEGAKIGAYEVAYKTNNLEDKWSHAYNILRQSNSTINSRYHGEGYVHNYWLYGQDRIYRQKLKPRVST